MISIVRVLYVTLCLAGMFGFAMLVKWGGSLASTEAVVGFAAGGMTVLILQWITEKIDQHEKRQRDRA